APTGTVARLARVVPGTQLRVDAVGVGASPGPTVRCDAAEPPVTVTLATTPDAPSSGIAVDAVASRMRGVVPTGVAGPPIPVRVSRMRSGVIGWKVDPSSIGLISVPNPRSASDWS